MTCTDSHRTHKPASAATTDFIIEMNHELRSPLQAILMRADLMLSDHTTSRTDADMTGLAAISQAGQHISAILDDILDLTTIESGRRTVELGPVPLDRACRDACDLMKPLATERQIDVIEATGDDGLAVLGNERGITQILINLISNAIKYNRPNGHVEVTVRAADHEVEVAVIDSGIGIAEELHDRIFRPFERFVPGEAGTGVGLTITQRLLGEMGSELTFSSTEGEGSRFEFRLPLAGRRHWH